MGFRFKKSFKIAPGIKINLNKKSVGITAGVKGAHFTANSKGKTTASVGLPGTGLSYQEFGKIGGSSHEKNHDKDNISDYNALDATALLPPSKSTGCLKIIFWIFFFLFFPPIIYIRP